MIKISSSKKIGIAVMVAIIACLLGTIYLITSNVGYKETKIVYDGREDFKDGTSEIYFKCDDFAEMITFKVPTEIADRLRDWREYNVERREKSDTCIQYKIKMPGIVDKVSKDFNYKTSERVAGGITKLNQNVIVTAGGDQNDDFKVQFGVGRELFTNTVTKEEYEKYKVGANVSIVVKEYINKDGAMISNYRLPSD